MCLSRVPSVNSWAQNLKDPTQHKAELPHHAFAGHSDRLAAPATFWISVARATHVMHLDRASTLIPRCRRLSWNDSKVRKAAPLFSNNTVRWQSQFLQLWQLAIFWWGLALCSYASFLPGAEAAGQGGREAAAGRDPVGMTTEVVLATARAVDVRAQVPGVTKTLQRHPKTSKDRKETMP